MSQKNYISSDSIPGEISPTQIFNFTGFLFYMDSWSWDNVEANSNLTYPEVRDSFNLIDFSDPYEAIKRVHSNISPDGVDFSNNPYTGRRYAELYLIAATCRRYQIYGTWRERFLDKIYPKFLESYTETITTKTAIAEGELTWPVWSGDIQAFTTTSDGKLEIGNYIFAKNLNIQGYTPVSIENSSKDLKFDKGYGEIISNKYIVNYYNNKNAYARDLLSLSDGWYGVVSLDSTPYVIKPGIGLDFDVFVKLVENRIVEFHESYPAGGVSTYGKKKEQYLNI